MRLAQGQLKTFYHLSSFGRMVQGRLKTFNRLCYFFVYFFHKTGTGQFTSEASARLSYFLLGSYSLSTFMSLVNLDFFLILGVKTNHSYAVALLSRSPRLYIFQMPMHLMVTLPTNMPLMWFTWHFFCLMFTFRHRGHPVWYPHNLHGLSKVKYITYNKTNQPTTKLKSQLLLLNIIFKYF